MRFSGDMGVSMTTVPVLQEQGLEVIHLRTGGYGRLSDAEILDKARWEKCVVLTFDLDFGDLLASTIQSLPSAIIFGMRNQTPGFGYTATTRNSIELQPRTFCRCYRDRGRHAISITAASNGSQINQFIRKESHLK